MTTWKFGTKSLSDYGKVTTVDDYLDIPERRGGNVVLPFRHGTLHAKKFYDERKITFGITIIQSSAANLESKIDDLKKLIAPRSPQTIEMTMENGAVRTAQAIVDSPLQINRFSAKIARAVLEFTLFDPFWRASAVIDDNTTTIDASPKAMTVTNPGTVEERDPTIILTGPLKNTVITNLTNGCVLTYGATIDSGKAVTIETVNGEYKATLTGGTNVIGNVAHSPESALLVIDAGDNTLSIADETHTTGTVKISFKAPYL